MIEIADTGIGMSAQDIELAVIPFSLLESREHMTRLRSSKADTAWSSTGLGLPLSKMVMEKQGGALTIESQIGKGTKVKIKFPATRVLPPLSTELQPPYDFALAKSTATSNESLTRD